MSHCPLQCQVPTLDDGMLEEGESGKVNNPDNHNPDIDIQAENRNLPFSSTSSIT